MHTSPNGKRYIGITKKRPKARWACGEGYKTSTHFYRAIQKHGWENFTHEILFENLTEEEAKKKEIELIAQYNLTDALCGYNMTVGGNTSVPLNGELNGMYGRTHTDEVKKRLSEQCKERFKDKKNHPMYGTKRSEETKKKLSESKKGLQVGDKNYFYGKHFNGELNPMYGKTHREETRKKISESQKGKYVGGLSWNAKKVTNIDTGESFDSVVDAVNKYGCCHSSICSCCRGKLKTAGGYRWEYEMEGRM